MTAELWEVQFSLNNINSHTYVLTNDIKRAIKLVENKHLGAKIHQCIKRTKNAPILIDQRAY